MKKHLAALILSLTFAGAAFAAITVAPPTNPLTAILTSAQVQQFTALVSGVPAGKTVVALQVRVAKDGTGQLSVITQ